MEQSRVNEVFGQIFQPVENSFGGVKHIHTRRHVAATLRGDKSLRAYRSGDKLLQQVARHVAVTNRLVRTPSGEFMCKSLSQ